MKIYQPVFIISCPRSGSSLLAKVLEQSNQLYSAYREGHYVWQDFVPAKDDFVFSSYLDELDFKALAEVECNKIYNYYHHHTFHKARWGEPTRILRFRNGLPWFFDRYLDLNYFCKEIRFGSSHYQKKPLEISDYRIIDKTPANVFKVKFLNKLFPDAKFIYLTRSGFSNISSLIDAWTSKGKLFSFDFRRKLDYQQVSNIKNYDDNVWKFLNPPGWQNYKVDSSIAKITAFQWLSANYYALRSFNEVNNLSHLDTNYETSSNGSNYQLRFRNINEQMHNYGKSLELIEGEKLSYENLICERRMNYFEVYDIAKYSESINELQVVSKLNNDKFMHVKYEDLINPDLKMQLYSKICDFSNIDFSQEIKAMIDIDPKVSIVEQPKAEKYKRNLKYLEEINNQIAAMQVFLEYESSL